MKINQQHCQPLDIVEISEHHGGSTMTVRDGEGVVYGEFSTTDTQNFRVSGALGTHCIFLSDANGAIIDEASFRVDCTTTIDDEGGMLKELLGWLHYTLESWLDGVGNDFTSRIDDKTYRYFVCWLRDHVHTMKGQKYFYSGELKTAIELYADTQRADGMIYDRVGAANPNPTWRDHTFANGDFIKSVANGKYRMERIPVENDVEFLYLEGLYFTWKACGDSAWMSRLLDSAIKAVNYAMNDQYRWSEKFQLLKRGYTIDTWDFVHADDGKLVSGNNIIDIDATTFGVMFGDNTGMAVGLEYLAEMLDHADRKTEAKKYAVLAQELRDRLDALAWNGEFYTHHVSEDPSFVRDFGGTDTSRQVSLSNAYSINRNIGHEKSVAIIESYQRIREEMPKTSPGEFYQIYPPFEKGYGAENGKWHYMNGGVGTIVAGELSHGAFENGHEAYGFDILKRVHAWGIEYNGYLPVALRGCAEETADRNFEQIDLRPFAQVDICGTGERPDNCIGWTGEDGNDLARFPTGPQELAAVPFDIIQPEKNNRAVAIGLSSQGDYLDEVSIPIGNKAQSIYLAHTLAGGGLAGWMSFHYANGDKEVVYVQDGQQIRSWFLPPANWSAEQGHGHVICKTGWHGGNDQFDSVGVYVWGHNNPHPELVIDRISFHAAENANKWFILGLNTCDSEVVFPGDGTSFGIPDCWGSSAVVYAILEGIAGVKDTGIAMDTVCISPRWAAANINNARAAVVYPSSGGYVSYDYAYNPEAKTLSIDIAANADQQELKLLLPDGLSASAVQINDRDVSFTNEQIEDSHYLCVSFADRGFHQVNVIL